MPKVTGELFHAIKEKYGNVSSWALWATSENSKTKLGMDDISFFENPLDTVLDVLNPNIVLVGLNISERIERIFGNFHPTSTNAQDYKTRFALQGTMFWGAYMTDIIKSFEEKISGNLMKYLQENKEFEKEMSKVFEQELRDIGSRNPILIAFGNDTYRILKRNLGSQYTIYKVPHYSAFIKLDSLRKAFTDLEETIGKN